MNEDVRRIGQMVECALAIQSYMKGRKRELATNAMLRDAVLHRFEVMGEAATHVSARLREGHPEIPWKRVIAFRNVLIHAYDRIEVQQLAAALDALPELVKQLRALAP